MRNRFLLLFIPVFFACTASSEQKDSGNWTHFRGSDLNGIAAEGLYPLEWNDSLNVKWYTAIDGRGWSSPVIYGKQIWLTSASPDGKEMFVVCLDLLTGTELFNIDMFHPEEVFRKHSINSYATPTSAIEEGFVYVSFGRYGTACIDTKTGEKVWERTDMQCEHVQGSGSSLLLHKDKLIVHMEGVDVQNIYALDKRTGETVWIAKRNPKFYEPLEEIGKKAYITPIIIEVDGRELLISNGSAVCNAYDFETGEEIWFIPQGEDSTISMPVEYKGKVYFFTSFVTPEEGEKYCELWAVDPRGHGDLSKNILWRKAFPILQLLTPVIYEDLIYTVDTKSVLHCLDAGSGDTIWTEKLKGKYNSSPIVANGHVYLSTTRGETLIFKTGRQFELVAQNMLSGEIWASPAFVDESIIMRTSKGVLRLGN